MADTLSIDLRHRYPASGFEIDVAVQAKPGVTALFGPSGSGKTSVVNAVAGLLRPQSGRIALGDDVLLDRSRNVDVPRHRRRVGYVFQDGRLFPHLTVRQNLLFGTRFAMRAPRTELDRVVERLGIGSLLDRYPAKLSGGEAQRVAIGRALLSGARLLLLDEPLAALDEARKAEVLPLLAHLSRQQGLPIIYVSHSVPEIVHLADTVVVMERGRVTHQGAITDVLADPSAPDILGPRTSGGLLRGTVRSARAADGLSEVATGGGPLYLVGIDAPAGTNLRVRVAAQDVILSRTRPEGLSALNVLAARVVGLGSEGREDRTVVVAVGDDRLAIRITARSASLLDFRPGDPCFAIIKVTGIDAGGFVLER